MTVTLDGSCRERLKTAAHSARKQLPQLEVAVLGGTTWTATGSPRSPRSRPPWNVAAACLIIDFQHGVRLEERRLRLGLSLPVRPRGGSTNNTLLALDAVISLAEAAGTGPASESALWLERWGGRAARVLGEASSIVHLPRQPGESERPCPFCSCLTLRYWPLHGLVKCVNPGCRDGEGKRPSARLEFSSFTQQLELVWQDGVSGLPPLPGDKVAS